MKNTSSFEIGSSLILTFFFRGHRVEPRDRISSIDDEIALALADLTKDRAEVVLCFGHAGSFHMAIIATTDHSFESLGSTGNPLGIIHAF